MKVWSFVLPALGLLALGTVAGRPALAAGPAFDTSGNANLNGTYYFRQVVYGLGDYSGDLARAISLNGSFVFEGNGSYYIPVGATTFDSNVGQQESFSATQFIGTYSLSATGYGFMTNPLYPSQTIYFMVSNGVLLGSTTEQPLSTYNGNDLLIATQLSNPVPSSSTLQGSWSMAGFLPAGTPGGAADIFFQMSADGAGNISGLSVPGYIGADGTTIETQTISGFKYLFSTGAAVLNFPNNSSGLYFSGPEYVNFSPDGNFMFGGSPYGWDMIVGVKNPPAGTTQTFFGSNGMYYQAGVDQDLSQYSANGSSNFDTYYGSLVNAGNGAIIAHERQLSLSQLSAQPTLGALGYTFGDAFPPSLTGPWTDVPAYIQFAYGTNATYRIGAGIYPYLGLNVAVEAPALTCSTVPGCTNVFLNPAGVEDSASSAPFTAGISNGELLTFYGTNLAPDTKVANAVPLPTTLDGVELAIDGIPAPLVYVSPGQISVVVPFELPSTYPVAKIQLSNNGALSNTITELVNLTTPGVYTNAPAGGLGYGAFHANGQQVNPGNPAIPGEIVESFVTGLGNVFPPIADGSLGQYPPAANAPENTISVDVGGTTADTSCQYCIVALAPGEEALYQINFVVPTTATSGDFTLDIGGPDSYATEALISVAAGPAASQRTEPSAAAAHPGGPAAQRATRVPPMKNPAAKGPLKAPCFGMNPCSAQQ